MSTSQTSDLDRVCDQVEQLLVMHEKLRHSHRLLQAQVAELLREREQMRARLDGAAGRIDAVLSRLPLTVSAADPAQTDVAAANTAPVLRGTP